MTIKKKAVIYSTYKSIVQQLATYFERSVYDVLAAKTLKGFNEILGFRTPEITILILSQDLLLYSDAELQQLANASEQLIILNLTKLRSAEIAVLFQKKPFKLFDLEGVLRLKELIKQNCIITKQGKVGDVRQALLLEENEESRAAVMDLLNRHHFQINLVQGMEEAELQLRENKYDLVIANATAKNGYGSSLINSSKQGFNKNTAIVLLSSSTNPFNALHFSAPRAWLEMDQPLDLLLLDEKVRSLPTF